MTQPFRLQSFFLFALDVQPDFPTHKILPLQKGSPPHGGDFFCIRKFRSGAKSAYYNATAYEGANKS